MASECYICPKLPIPIVVGNKVWCTHLGKLIDYPEEMKQCRGYIEMEGYPVPDSFKASIRMEYSSAIQVSESEQLQVWASPKHNERDTHEDLEKFIDMTTDVYLISTDNIRTLVHRFNSLPIITYSNTIDKPDVLVKYDRETIEVKVRDPVYNIVQDGIRIFVFTFRGSIYLVHERKIYLYRTKNQVVANFADASVRAELGRLITTYTGMTEGRFLHVIISPIISLKGPVIPTHLSIVISSNFDGGPRPNTISMEDADKHLKSKWYNSIHVRDRSTGTQFIIQRPEVEAAGGLTIVPYTSKNISDMYINGGNVTYDAGIDAFSRHTYNTCLVSDRPNSRNNRFILSGIKDRIYNPIDYILNGSLIKIEDNKLIITEHFDVDKMIPVSYSLSTSDIKAQLRSGAKLITQIINEYAYTILSAIILSYNPEKEARKHKSEVTISAKLYLKAREVILYILNLEDHIINKGNIGNYVRIPGFDAIKRAAYHTFDGETDNFKRRAVATYIVNSPLNRPIHKEMMEFLYRMD